MTTPRVKVRKPLGGVGTKYRGYQRGPAPLTELQARVRDGLDIEPRVTRAIADAAGVPYTQTANALRALVGKDAAVATTGGWRLP